MNDERRRLLLARDTWRSMHPTQMEVLRAAKRIATRFQPRTTLSFGRRVRMVSGALATIAGIAYAGSGGWADIAGSFGRGPGTRGLDDATTAIESRTTGPRDPMAERVGVVPERLAVDSPAPAPAESAPKAKKKLAHGGAHGTVSRQRRVESADGKGLVASIDRVDPTWADVNAALGTRDVNRAESLLLQLADGWRDADTRAKANLGLAQLAAARGDCERARVLALGVAAAPGIEMKTVRRALELAVRCAH
ncbi:MAG TPA: hypothetical protein VK550_04050 [Polyangiaceae bacterium]|nr:hypothetical protein [Polyangiaceae bacterium]